MFNQMYVTIIKVCMRFSNTILRVSHVTVPRQRLVEK